MEDLNKKTKDCCKVEESIKKLIEVSNNLNKIKKLQVLRIRDKQEKWQT